MRTAPPNLATDPRQIMAEIAERPSAPGSVIRYLAQLFPSGRGHAADWQAAQSLWNTARSQVSEDSLPGLAARVAQHNKRVEEETSLMNPTKGV